MLEDLASSSIYGNLGVFAGAGVSMAIMNNGWETIALSWGQLLDKASSKFDIDFNSDISSFGFSYPDLATKLCKKIAEKEDVKYETAVSKLKEKLAELTSWYPDKAKRDEYSQLFIALNPSWIITTNYDLILETILTGRSISLGPDNQLVAPKGFIPIYHLHGIRTNPNSIIITQEDYISLFRPNEYRHIKLPLTIKESTTLILGYGLGDINVLTALDWSKNVFEKLKANHPDSLIQVLRKEKPNSIPYLDNNNIVIIETNEISSFLVELGDIINEKLNEESDRESSLMDIETYLKNPDTSGIEKFIDDKTYRLEIIELLSDFKDYLISGFLEYLSKVIEKLWERAQPNGAFYAYAEQIEVYLDILINSNINNMPPALIEMVAYNLNSVGSYVGLSYGKSHEAHRLWEKLKHGIPNESIKELRNIAFSHDFYQLKKLLSGL